MKAFKISFLLAATLFLSFCVRARITPYPNIDYPPSDEDDIQVYYMPPTLSFEIIGEVRADGAPAASWDSVESYMKKEAATIGGDAIVLIDKREEYAGTYTTPSSGNAFVSGNYVYYTYRPGTSFAMKRKRVVGIVIKWNDDLDGDREKTQKTKLYMGHVTVHLNDESSVKGRILSQGEQSIILLTSLGELKIEKNRIASIDPDKENVEVYLKDGSLLKAKIITENEHTITVDTALGELHVKKENINKIERAQEVQGDTTESDVIPGAERQIEIKEGDLVPIDSVDKVPVLKKKVTPKYNWKNTQLITQVFRVDVLISETGSVEHVKIIDENETYELMNRSVMEAVKKWKFKAATKDGVNVKVWQKFNIRLNRR